MDYQQHTGRINGALEKFGGLYTWEDILDGLQKGDMQMFSYENSFVVTKVSDYPRKRVLDLMLAYGVKSELKELEPQLLRFAEKVGATTMMASMSRRGWEAQMVEGDGWTVVGTMFLKDL